MAVDIAVERFLRRDRWVILAGTIAVTVLAWLYIASLPAGRPMPAASDMRMGEMDMGNMGAANPSPPATGWAWEAAGLTFAMWTVMMLAMMTPSAAPVILLYGLLYRKRIQPGSVYAPTAAFYSGYLVVWLGFSALAVALQWGLESAALLSPDMMSARPTVGGIMLIGAGLYQLSPLKQTCLRACRGPAEFLAAHWRPGAGGAFAMGVRHGWFCLGCCWALMLILFAVGVMNLVWVALLAAFVLVEKLAPSGVWIGRIGALVMIAAGVVYLTVGAG